VECEEEFYKHDDGAYGVCIPKTKLVMFNIWLLYLIKEYQ